MHYKGERSGFFKHISSVRVCMCVHVLVYAYKQRKTSAISTRMASMLLSEMASVTRLELTSLCREQKSWDRAFWALGWRNYNTHPPVSACVLYRVGQRGGYSGQLDKGRSCYAQIDQEAGFMVYS